MSKNEDLIEAFELLKAYCKNRECNKDCIFYRELRAGNNIEQFCGLCDIVTSNEIFTCPASSESIIPFKDFDVTEWFPHGAPNKDSTFTVYIKR